MTVYEFTLFVPPLDDDTINTIYSACDDVCIGTTHGETYVAFDREAGSLEAALNEATRELRGFGIEPTRVEMDVPELALA